MSETAPRQPRINYRTGAELTGPQAMRLESLAAHESDILALLHECEGSNAEGYHFSTRTMSLAATYLEISFMFARKAAVEVK